MSVQRLPIAAAADIPLALATVVDLPEDAQWERFVTHASCADVLQTNARAQTKKALGLEVGRVIERGCVMITVGSQIIVKRPRPPGGERSDTDGVRPVCRAIVFPAVHPQVSKRISEGNSLR
jgi:hypothetical protein